MPEEEKPPADGVVRPTAVKKTGSNSSVGSSGRLPSLVSLRGQESALAVNRIASQRDGFGRSRTACPPGKVIFEERCKGEVELRPAAVRQASLSGSLDTLKSETKQAEFTPPPLLRRPSKTAEEGCCASPSPPPPASECCGRQIKGVVKSRLRLCAAAAMTLFATAITSLIVAGGTRQVLIHSVNKGLGQMARIDASVVTSDLALTAITSSWACNAFSATPGLAHPINGSADSLTFVYQLLQQTLTAQGALIVQKDGTAALAAYVEPGATVMKVGVLNAETDMCWVTYEVQAAALQDMAGEPAVANRDCEFISSGRFAAMASASEHATLVADPFTGIIRAASRTVCANAVVTAYADLHGVRAYLRQSTERHFRDFWPDLGVLSGDRRKDLHEFVLVNTSDVNSTHPFHLVLSSQRGLESSVASTTTGIPLSEAPEAMRAVTPYLSDLSEATVGAFQDGYFMTAELLQRNLVTGSTFAQPMVLVVLVPATQFVGFMPNLIVLNFIVCASVVAAYVFLLSIGIPSPPKKGDRWWRQLRCFLGYLSSIDEDHLYTPVAVLIVMLLITVGLWRSALDVNLAVYRRDGIAHHTTAIADFVQTFTGMSVMAFTYMRQLFEAGRLPLPPNAANIPALDVAFGTMHRPLFPYSGIAAIYVGLDTDELAGAGWMNDTYAIRAKDPSTKGAFTWYSMLPDFQRNASGVLQLAPDYSVLKRDWFKKVDPGGRMSYLPPYHFHSFVGFGIAWNAQVNVTFGGKQHKAVLAVETLVIQISEMLAHFRRSVEQKAGDAIFIVDRGGLLIGSADKVVTKGKPGVGALARDERISPSESPNAAVRLTFDGLVRWMGEPAQWPDVADLVVNQDGDEGPYVAAITAIRDEEEDRDWLLVLSYPDTETRKLEPILIMTLILSIAVGLLILYAITAISDALGPTTVPPPAEIVRRYSRCCSREDFLEDDPYEGLKRFLLPLIVGSGFTALTFIRLSWSTMDALELLRISAKRSRVRSFLYYLFHSQLYTAIIVAAALAFLFLAFFEAPLVMRRSLFDPEHLHAVIITASVLLFVLALDCVVWLVTVGFKRLAYDPATDRLVRKRNLAPLAYGLLLLAFTIDLIMQSMGHYNRPLIESDDQGQLVVLLLPSTAFLRPLLLLVRFREARNIGRRFLATILKALPVLGLFLLVILLTSAMSNLLFAGRVNSAHQGQGFSTILASFVQSFVMSTCGDNWGDVVNSIRNCGAHGHCKTPAWVYVYFVFVSLVGTVMTVSLLIQAFQEHYVSVLKEHLDHMEADRDVNMVAAYCVLDDDDNGVLDVDEFAVLLEDMASCSGIGIKVILERPSESTFVSLPVFLRLARKLEPLGWFRPYLHNKTGRTDKPKEQHFTGQLVSDRLEGDLCDKLASELFGKHPVHVLLILNFTTIALYGYVTSAKMLKLLDLANLLLLIYWAAEPLYPICRYGFRLFWHVDDDFYLQTTRRFVFSITVPPMLVFLISRAVDQRLLWAPWTEDSPNDATRVVLTIPLIRVLVLLPGLRRMCLGLMVVLYNLGEQLAGCALMLYAFAAVGCRLFAGKLSLLADYPVKTLNFDSMESSMVTLYNVFISGNVSEVLNGIMDTSSLIIGLLYFLLFLFFLEVIYLSLVTSVVCQLYEATQRVNHAAEVAQRPFTSLDFWIMFSDQMRSAFSDVPGDEKDPDFQVEFPEAAPNGAPVDWTLCITLK